MAPGCMGAEKIRDHEELTVHLYDDPFPPDGEDGTGEPAPAQSARADGYRPGPLEAVAGRDGHAFAGEVEAMDVCTGQVTIRGAGQPSARITP